MKDKENDNWKGFYKKETPEKEQSDAQAQDIRRSLLQSKSEYPGFPAPIRNVFQRILENCMLDMNEHTSIYLQRDSCSFLEVELQ